MAPSARAQFARASETATVLFASEFHWLVEALDLSACVSPRCRFLCPLRPKEQCLALTRTATTVFTRSADALHEIFSRARDSPIDTDRRRRWSRR